MSLSSVVIVFTLITMMVHGNNTNVSFINGLLPRNMEAPIKALHRDHLMIKYDYPFADFPYLLSVFSDFGIDLHIYKFICSGSLITFYWGITAASCMPPSLKNTNASYLAYAGVIPDPVITINEYPGEYFRGEWQAILDWIIHPNFNYTKETLPINDIALLHVEVPFNFHSYIGIVRLLPYSFMKECDVAKGHQSCQVPVYENKTLDVNNKLIFLTVYLTGVRNCKITVDGKILTAGYSHICSMTSIELGSRGCLGSLGSPLICNKQQVGIMLDVYSCGETHYGLYTRVDLYQEWIQKYVTTNMWYSETNTKFMCIRSRRTMTDSDDDDENGENRAVLLYVDLFVYFYCWLLIIVM